MLSCRVEVEKQDRNKNKSSAVVPNSWRKVYLSVGNDNQRLCFYKLLFSLLLTMSMYYCIKFLNLVINTATQLKLRTSKKLRIFKKIEDLYLLLARDCTCTTSWWWTCSWTTRPTTTGCTWCWAGWRPWPPPSPGPPSPPPTWTTGQHTQCSTCLDWLLFVFTRYCSVRLSVAVSLLFPVPGVIRFMMMV